MPIVLREILAGSTRFNDIQRGVPRMSPSLLSRRLSELVHAGIVERRPVRKGKGSEYHLTEAGEAMRPVILSMAEWAQNWSRDELTVDENLDADVLMWDMRRTVDASGIPANDRYVAQFEFSGVPVKKRRYWLLFDRGEIDLCQKDPGYEVGVFLHSHIRTMVQIWLGHIPVRTAVREGKLRIEGARSDVKAFQAWFTRSIVSGYADPTNARAKH